MLSKIYQKKGLALFLIINLWGVLKPYLGLDLIDPSLVLFINLNCFLSICWTKLQGMLVHLCRTCVPNLWLGPLPSPVVQLTSSS